MQNRCPGERVQNEKRVAHYYFHLSPSPIPPHAPPSSSRSRHRAKPTGASRISGGSSMGYAFISHLSFAAGCLRLLGIRRLIYPIELCVPVKNSPGFAAIHQYSLQSPDSCSLWAGSTCADLIFSHRAEEELGKISYISDSPKHSVYL